MKKYQRIFDIDKSKKQYQETLSKRPSEEKLKSLIKIQEKAYFFNKVQVVFTENSMRDVIDIFNDLKEKELIADFSLGGATALLFYATPQLTEDIDIFIHLKNEELIVGTSPIYSYLKFKYKAIEEREYLKINGAIIQVGDTLTEEAFDNSVLSNHHGKKFKVFDFEYLIAIMLQLYKPKYISRLITIIEENKFDYLKLEKILHKHKLMDKWDKVNKLVSDTYVE